MTLREPTIHPGYVDFIRLGRAAGYSKIQTVTNGRMFKWLRCRTCLHDGECRGLYIDHVRAHGHGVMRPVSGDA